MFFSLVIATALLSNALGATCPSGYTYFGSDNSCIKGVSSTATYSEARSACQREGGDLVKITSKAKSDMVYDLTGSGYLWIGVDDIRNEGTFTFSDGSPLTTYQNWNSGEPNDYWGKEDCAHLINRDRGLWNDIDCNNKFGYACETTAKSVCSEGYTYSKAGDACLKAYSNLKTFDEARQVCQSENTDLVIVTDAAMTAFVQQLAGGGHIWMGVTDRREEGTFEHIDGSPLTSYKPWNDGEPNNYGGNEDCAHIIGKEHNRPHPWNDIDCNAKMKFVCEETRKCPSGYTFYEAEDSCLKAHSDEKSFDEARQVCHSENADLVTVNTADKSDFVYALAGRGHIWLGVTDIRQEGTFEQIDGSPLTLYQPWNDGEPNNYNGNEDCVHLIGKEHNRERPWNDIACSAKMKYVCEQAKRKEPEVQPTPKPVTEKPKPEVQPTQKPVTEKVLSCDDGWKQNGDVCIKVFNNEKQSFDGARAFCQGKGGDLATAMKTKKDRNFVKKLLTKREYYWVGIHSPNEDGNYQYVDGSSLGSYNAFKKGEPNSKKGKEHCVQMLKGLWMDKRCNKKRKVVCQKNAH